MLHIASHWHRPGAGGALAELCYDFEVGPFSPQCHVARPPWPRLAVIGMMPGGFSATNAPAEVSGGGGRPTRQCQSAANVVGFGNRLFIASIGFIYEV